MKRRTMLLGTAGAGLVAYGGAIGFGAMTECAPYGAEALEVASARRIGERLLALGFGAGEGLDDDLPTLRARLGQDMRRDFAAGHTVDCDGWVLSRSEARYCIASARSAPARS